MSAAIIALLTVLAQIIPALSNSAAITSIINALISLIPIIVKEMADIKPLVENIIDAMRENSVVTQQQLDDLVTLEEKLDAEFEAAVAMPDETGMPE